MARAGLVRSLGGFPVDLPQGEDDHLWLQLARRADFYYLPQVTAAYVQRSGSLTDDGTAPGHWKQQSLARLLGDADFAPWHAALRRRLAQLHGQEAAYHARHGARRQALRAAWGGLRLRPVEANCWKSMVRGLLTGGRP